MTTKKRIRKLHAQGLNDRQIANLLKMTPSNVCQVRRTFRLPANAPRGQKSKGNRNEQ